MKCFQWEQVWPVLLSPRFLSSNFPFTMTSSPQIFYADAVLFDMVCFRVHTRARFVLNWTPTGWYSHGLDSSNWSCLGQSRRGNRGGSWIHLCNYSWQACCRMPIPFHAKHQRAWDEWWSNKIWKFLFVVAKWSACEIGLREGPERWISSKIK